MKKLKLFSLALMALFTTSLWGAASTSTDGKTASGTITFAEVGTLSKQINYWYNGLRFYEYSTNNISDDKSKRWKTSVSPATYGTFTSGSNWAAGEYDMTGLLLQAHCLSVNVGSPCTIEVIVNMSGAQLGQNNPVVPTNLKVFWDGTAYDANYTTSNYKTGTAKTDTTWEQNINGKYNRMKLSIPVSKADLDAKDIDVIKISYTGSASGSPSYSQAFVYESVKIIPETKYSVTYLLDGGLYNGSSTAPTQESVYKGTSITLPSLTPTKEDYNFLGWTCDIDDQDYDEGAAYTMTAANTTFTAHWISSSAATHAINYAETKGAINSNPAEYTEGVGIASFEPLADVTNFHFTGWSPASIAADATTDPFVVTAQWVAAYDVTFELGTGASGTAPASFQKWATATFELPDQGEMEAPDGKAFNGWKDQDDATFAAGDTYTMPAKAVTLTAQWVDIYEVTFNLQGHGDAISEQNIADGRKATKPADPFAIGYVFDGWYKEEACTNAWDFAEDVVTEDTELFANWISFTKNAEIIFATSGDKPTKDGDKALLTNESHGGTVTFVGAKSYDSSFSYNEYGLQLGGGSKDSIKVVLNSTLQVGSYIQLDMSAGNNSGSRGLKIKKAGQGDVYNASWNAVVNDHRIITYKVKNGDGLDGKNTFWLQRNNTVILKQIIIGNWYVDPTALDNTEDEVKAVKVLRDGQLFIEKNGHVYNVFGACVK